MIQPRERQADPRWAEYINHQTHLEVLLEEVAPCRHSGYQKSLFSMSLLLECGRGLGQHLPGEKENGVTLVGLYRQD